MSAHLVRDAVRDGRISPEQGARLLELHYELAKLARRARLRRAVKRWLCAPLRWIGRRP